MVRDFMTDVNETKENLIVDKTNILWYFGLSQRAIVENIVNQTCVRLKVLLSEVPSI